MHINSINDVSISCKNFMNFGPVTPELTELICELLVQQGKKTGWLVGWSLTALLTQFRSYRTFKVKTIL